MIKSERLNKLNPKATFGANKFSDLSEGEFNTQYLMNFDAANYVAPAKKTNFGGKAHARGCNPDPTNVRINEFSFIYKFLVRLGLLRSCYPNLQPRTMRISKFYIDIFV